MAGARKMIPDNHQGKHRFGASSKSTYHDMDQIRHVKIAIISSCECFYFFEVCNTTSYGYSSYYLLIYLKSCTQKRLIISVSKALHRYIVTSVHQPNPEYIF